MPATFDHFSNFATSTIAYGAGGVGTVFQSTDTSFTLKTGDGAKFPSSTPFMVEASGASLVPELMKCTAIAGDTLTVTRAQEGTLVQTWPVGATVQCVATAGSFADLWTRVQEQTFDVTDYGAVGDGATDNTTAINNAVAAASADGGGTVLFPPGTYLTGTITLASYVQLKGSGITATTLKLKNGTNADLINGGATNLSYINVTAASGTGNSGGLSNWTIRDMTLDGNRGNQAGGTSYVIRIYGYGFQLNHLRVRNGYSGGILLDWNGSGAPSPVNDEMEAQCANLKIHDNNGVNLTIGGPHDSQFANIFCFGSGSHNVYLGPHANGILFTNLHAWGSALGVLAVAVLVEGTGCQFTNCVAEGSDTVQLVILANNTSWVGGDIYGSVAHAASGVQLGQAAGNTPYAGSSFQSGGLTTAVGVSNCVLDSMFQNCTGTHGTLWFANDTGTHLIRGGIYQTSGQVFSGAMNGASQINLTISGGLIGGSNRDITQLSGSLALGGFSSVQTITTGGTINVQGFTVAMVTCTSSVTGVILQTPSFSGQFVLVVNNSANTLTFAASSSNVAGGSTVVIPAHGGKVFYWDWQTTLWYPC